jgi:hypothetical protein
VKPWRVGRRICVVAAAFTAARLAPARGEQERAAAPRSRIFSIDDKTLTIALHSRVARVSYAHRPQEPLESVMHLILDFVLVMAAAVPPGLRYIRRTRVADDWDPY